MKPNDQLSKFTPQGRLYFFAAIFLLALCLVSAGVVILNNPPALEEGQNQETLRSRSTSESSLVESPVKSPEGEPREVEKAELAGAAGRQVYLDPVTGKLGTPPPVASNNQSSPEQQIDLRYSSEGLVEVPLTGPAGGVAIDLQGRFRSETVVTIDAKGNLTTRCTTTSGVVESKATHREK